MKNVNGIQTLFDNAICPVPSPGGGAGVKDVGGVSIPDGQKGTSGEMPEVSGVSLKDDDAASGPARPSHMAGS